MFNPNHHNSNNLNSKMEKTKDLIPNSDNIFLNRNNTGLICVLQCLYAILKYNYNNSFESSKFIAKYYSKISFSFDFKFFHNFDENIDFNNFKNEIQKLSNCLIKKNKNDSKQMIPKWIFSEIFSNFNKDIIDNDIPWTNKIFDKLIEPAYLSRKFFPKLSKDIEQFKNNYKNVFVDNFYFILLTLTKCSKCNDIINEENFNVKSFISIESNENDKVSNLIKKILFDEKNNKDNNNYYCQKCQINIFRKPQKAFFNSPKFLLIDFYGSVKNSIKLKTK